MEHSLSPYLRLIQKTGTTRHPGGFYATDILLKRTRLKKTSRVLDVGCGAGHTSAFIAKNYGCSVTGVDISSEALDRVKSFYGNEPFFKRMSFEVGDACNLPYSDGYFDVVLCESVLFFVADKETALKEMSRVVKPGGFLALNELCLTEKDGLQNIKDYFLRPEFGGFITKSRNLEELINDDFSIVVKDEQPFDIKSQLRSELRHWITSKGVLQLFEFIHHTVVNKESRSDVYRLLRFILDMPKGTLDHLNALLLLLKKRGN